MIKSSENGRLVTLIITLYNCVEQKSISKHTAWPEPWDGRDTTEENYILLTKNTNMRLMCWHSGNYFTLFLFYYFPLSPNSPMNNYFMGLFMAFTGFSVEFYTDLHTQYSVTTVVLQFPSCTSVGPEVLSRDLGLSGWEQKRQHGWKRTWSEFLFSNK